MHRINSDYGLNLRTRLLVVELHCEQCIQAISETRQRHTGTKSNINQGLTNIYMTLQIHSCLSLVRVKTSCAKWAESSESVFKKLQSTECTSEVPKLFYPPYTFPKLCRFFCTDLSFLTPTLQNKTLPIEDTTDCLSTMACVCRVMLETP